MQLLFICEHFASSSTNISGGVESQVKLITQALENKHQITVLCGRRQGEQKHQQQESVTIHRLGPTLSGLGLGLNVLFQRLGLFFSQVFFSLKIKPDIVVGFNYTTYLTAFLISKLKACPSIAWYPDVLLGEWKKYFGLSGWQGFLAESISLKLPFNHFVAISQKTKSLLVNHKIDSNKITVIYPAVNPQFFLTKPKTRLNKILVVSRNVKYKNLNEAKEIFKIVKKTLPKAKLVIVGPGFKLHHLPLNQLISIMQSSKVILHPSLIEGFGLTPVEAAACGCVPLVKASTISKEVHPPQFYYSTYQEAAQKIIRVLTDNQYFLKQSITARKLAQNYSLSNLQSSFIKLIDQYATT